MIFSKRISINTLWVLYSTYTRSIIDKKQIGYRGSHRCCCRSNYFCHIISQSHVSNVFVHFHMYVYIYIFCNFLCPGNNKRHFFCNVAFYIYLFCALYRWYQEKKTLNVIQKCSTTLNRVL